MVLIFKVLLVFMLIFIIFNLARAMFEMVKNDGSDTETENDEEQSKDNKPMSYYLGRRVFLSALAVILMIVALLSGFLEPNVRPY
jgi:quinol-cytochrome oxidoreductase complex cytochrome b subunit|tara:strand:- start:144 stop:398 length:255 start_codon:yes stop_codon:yes gene_type:complete